jgi:hypothetical protein
MLPDDRRGSSLSTLRRGDIVQIKRGRDPLHPHDNFGGSLFRVTRPDPWKRGIIHGVHLVDHRAGALEGTGGYQIQDLVYIGSIPDDNARQKAEVAKRESTEQFAARAAELHELKTLIQAIKTADTKSRLKTSRPRK